MMTFDEALKTAKEIQLLEFVVFGYTRPEYHFEGREIVCGAVTEEQNTALNQAEVFLCHKLDGTYLVLRDISGKGRETKLS